MVTVLDSSVELIVEKQKNRMARNLKKIAITWSKVAKGKYAQPTNHPTDQLVDFGWVVGVIIVFPKETSKSFPKQCDTRSISLTLVVQIVGSVQSAQVTRLAPSTCSLVVVHDKPKTVALAQTTCATN